MKMRNGLKVFFIAVICAVFQALPAVAQYSQDAWTAQLPPFTALHKTCTGSDILVPINGTKGICMEANYRNGGAPASFEDARKTCIEDGKRLPEVAEYVYACHNVSGFSDMPNSSTREWGSNFTFVTVDSNVQGNWIVMAASVGFQSCTNANYGSISSWNNAFSTLPFRCVS
jgi:hypothetical protein